MISKVQYESGTRQILSVSEISVYTVIFYRAARQKTNWRISNVNWMTFNYVDF